jgi:predicted RNA-binding protein with PIN domain
MTARRLLVDGMNVIGSRPDGWWRDRPAAMDRLVRELESVADQWDEVTVVFDGRPRPGPCAGAVEVLFARRAGRDAADDRIVEVVAGDEDPGGLLVVTSDRGLGDRARTAGATVVPVSWLRDRIAEATPRTGRSGRKGP